MLEKELERKLVQEVRSRHGLCMKWVCPGNSGVPDRLVLLPGSRVVMVELKRPQGARTDPLQVYWARELRRRGFAVYKIHTPEELTKFLQEIGEA